MSVLAVGDVQLIDEFINSVKLLLESVGVGDSQASTELEDLFGGLGS